MKTVSVLRRLCDDDIRDHSEKTRLLMLLLLAVNAAAWAVALLLFHHSPLLLGSAMLAYTFGLRHAVDADHIAAIDNVTRKLMEAGKRPLSVGLMFSLGHATVVVLATLTIVVASTLFQGHFGAWREVGAVIGGTVSSLFLIGIALANCTVLYSLYGQLRLAKRSDVPAAARDVAIGTGPLVRVFAALFGRIHNSWGMYPLGLLFALSFDTATTIGLLSIGATQSLQGLPGWSILIFPLLFTAGMTLIDTANGILMLNNYSVAFAKPVRKLYYNFTVTLASIVVAFVIGGLSGFGLLAQALHFHGGLTDLLTGAGANLNYLGLAVLALFFLIWMGSMAMQRFDSAGPEKPQG